MEYTVDAQNRKLGRVATEVATLLMGKKTPDFTRNAIPSTKVTVLNSSKMEVSTKKMLEKTYKTYSGYPGGLKEKSMEKLTKDKGFKEALKIAVKGMLPKNKLRDRMMKNLTINE